MKLNFFLGLCLVATGVAACGEAETATPAADVAVTDGDAADGGADAGVDAGVDTGADTVGDGAEDAQAAEVADTVDAADAADTADVSDTADAPDTADVPDTTDAPDASDTADATAPGVSCGASPLKFPAFSKACSSDTDCFVGLHQVNCCGTLGAIGLSTSQKDAFAAAEAVCQAQYPDCKCAQQPTVGEDGYTAKDSEFKAICQEGVCRAVVPGAKAECSSGGLVWPKPVKTCQVQTDCTYVLKTVDCCGSQNATGIAKFAKAAFEAAEVKCATSMAICDCMPKPVIHDDGSSAGDGMTAVQCLDGACSTYAK